MNSNDRVQLILELLDGKATATELAERHGLEEKELLAWRDTWLAGARAASRARAPSRRLWVLGAVLGAAALGLMSKEAIAATCAAPASFSSLGLNYFCPNDPALASEFNTNTAQLVGLMQQKLGAGWGLPDAGVSTAGITTSAATVTGAATLTGGATVGSTANVSFGTTTRQMLNLWGSAYGIGVQDNTFYSRSGGNFAWYVGGSHSNTELNSGGGTETMRLSPSGVLSLRGQKQIDYNIGPARMEISQLIVEATPVNVGIATGISRTALEPLCRDDDGCSYTIGMVNYDNNGGITSRSGRLFMSQTNNEWRTESDVQGTDGNNSSTEFGVWDCYFGDFDNNTDTNNGRTDGALGFGLLNARGGMYSDTFMTCRMVFRD